MEARQEVRLKEAVRQPTKKHGSRETRSLNQPTLLWHVVPRSPGQFDGINQQNASIVAHAWVPGAESSTPQIPRVLGHRKASAPGTLCNFKSNCPTTEASTLAAARASNARA